MVPGTLNSQIPPCTGVCAVSGKRLEPGDPIMVALFRQDGLVQRVDVLRGHFDNLSGTPWAVWQSTVPAEVPSQTAAAEMALTEVVFSEDTPTEVRWDACQRLARKRKMALSRVPKQDGLFLARCAETGREVILRAPTNA